MVQVLNARPVRIDIGRLYSGRAMIQRTTDSERQSTGATHEIAWKADAATGDRGIAPGMTLQADDGRKYQIVKLARGRHERSIRVALCKVVG